MSEQRFAGAVRKAIRDAMATSAVDQRELAHRLGVSEARVSQLLDGGNLTLRSVDRILEALQAGGDFTIGAIVTAEEAAIVEGLGEVWNAYLALPIEHPNDRLEFLSVVHDAQRHVLARAGRRRLSIA